MSPEDDQRRPAPDFVLMRAGSLQSLAKALAPAFSPLPSLVLLAASTLVLLSRAFYWAPSNIVRLFEAVRPGELAAGMALTLVGLVVHEIGHAAAARRSGRRARELGVTLAYRIVPAFYLQLEPTPASATRWQRLSTELGGSGLQLTYAAVLVLWSIAAPAFDVLVAAVLTVILALWQLLPLPGQDGAYALRALLR